LIHSRSKTRRPENAEDLIWKPGIQEFAQMGARVPCLQIQKLPGPEGSCFSNSKVPQLIRNGNGTDFEFGFHMDGIIPQF